MDAYILADPWIPLFWPIHGSLYSGQSMDAFIQIGPWTPILKSVRETLYSGRSMDLYMQIGPWIPILRSVRGSLHSGRSANHYILTGPWISVFTEVRGSLYFESVHGSLYSKLLDSFWIWLIISFWSRYDSFHFHYPPIIINMSHIIWLFIISPMEMAILRVKLVWLLDALWRPLFLVIESSWSQLGTSSKMDSGRLKLYTKSLRNFNKIYAFRPEPNLELFQVQIRTDL